MSELARRRSWNKIACFYALTLLFSAPFYALILGTGQLRGSEMFYVTALMWSPALAALATQRLFGDDLAALGWRFGALRWQLWAWFLPVGYALPVYVLVWFGGLGHFQFAEFTAQKAEAFGWQALSPALVFVGYVLLAGTAGLVLSLSRALGEEIGWRGLLVPELAKLTGTHGVAIGSGLMWAAWHYPVLIFGDYNAGTPIGYALACFTLMAIGVSYLMAWLRLASGTLWTAAVLHAAHNRFIQGVFTPLTGDSGPTPYLIDEFGIGLAVSTLLTALLVLRYVRRPQ